MFSTRCWDLRVIFTLVNSAAWTRLVLLPAYIIIISGLAPVVIKMFVNSYELSTIKMLSRCSNRGESKDHLADDQWYQAIMYDTLLFYLEDWRRWSREDKTPCCFTLRTDEGEAERIRHPAVLPWGLTKMKQRGYDTLSFYFEGWRRWSREDMTPCHFTLRTDKGEAERIRHPVVLPWELMKMKQRGYDTLSFYLEDWQRWSREDTTPCHFTLRTDEDEAERIWHPVILPWGLTKMKQRGYDTLSFYLEGWWRWSREDTTLCRFTLRADEDEAERIRHPAVIVLVLVTVHDVTWLQRRKFLSDLFRGDIL